MLLEHQVVEGIVHEAALAALVRDRARVGVRAIGLGLGFGLG